MHGMGGHRKWTKRATTALLLAGLLAACSSGGDDDEGREPVEREEDSGDEQVEALSSDEAVEIADEWIDGYDALDDEGRESLELLGTRRSPGVTHVRYRQVFDDVPVRAAQLVVNVTDDGEVLAASDSLTDARPDPGVEQQIDEPEATDIAGKAVPDEVQATTAANVVWLQDGEDLRLGWSVSMQVAGNTSYTVWVDAVSGEVADARETRLEYGHGLPAQAGGCDAAGADGPAACVFVPDPVSSSGSFPSVDEANAGERSVVELQGLDDPDSGALVGEFVNLESQFDPSAPIREPDGVWDQTSDEPGFEHAMTYFWIDTAQRLIQDLGFEDVRNESFEIVPRFESEVDNAFFDPSVDAIFLGVGSNGEQDAGEDAQVILHEYGHAVLHQQLPNMIFNDAGGAYHDGFADAFAGLITLGLSDDPGCLFPWFLGPLVGDECGRRFDTDKVFPEDIVNEVHADGEIWTGAVFDVLEDLLANEGLTFDDCVGSDACNEVRDRVLATILAANEFLTGTESYPEIAQGFVLANDAVFGGADADIVEDNFADHGFVPGGDTVVDDEGQPTGDIPAVEAAVDISHSFRGDLGVTLLVVDAAFENLCSPITLLDPVPGDAADNVSGTADVSATDCAQFAPPSADQQWVLFVEDTAEADVGQVNGFAVIVDGIPFLATGVPAPIADNDPAGTAVIVNASGDAVDQEGQEEPSDTAGGAVFASVEISHSFVGDLQVRAGAVDPNTGDILCSVPILEPDPQDDGDDIAGEVDLSACAQFFPPSAGAAWFLEVVDTAAIDSGTIERFDLFAGDGTLVGSADVPVAIPDDDPAGAAAIVFG
jgi:subtilisin-like proprotein convertase family protein